MSSPAVRLAYRSAGVHAGLAGRTRLETPVHPQILLWRAADLLLDELIDAQGILRDVAAGKILQRRVDIKLITLPMWETYLEKRHHRRAGQVRQPRGGGDGRGGDAEEGHEDTVFPAIEGATFNF